LHNTSDSELITLGLERRPPVYEVNSLTLGQQENLPVREAGAILTWLSRVSTKVDRLFNG